MPASQAGRSILLVEDEAMLRTLLSAQLDGMGFRVQAVASGDEAMEAIDMGATFDVLLTDVRMPGKIDGVELAKRVRAISRHPKIIVMSGYVGHQDASAQAIENFLPKPFTAGRLRQELARVAGN